MFLDAFKSHCKDCLQQSNLGEKKEGNKIKKGRNRAIKKIREKGRKVKRSKGRKQTEKKRGFTVVKLVATSH
jgi:hypothetical protein